MNTSVNDKFSKSVEDAVAKSRMAKAAKVWKEMGGKIVVTAGAK